MGARMFPGGGPSGSADDGRTDDHLSDLCGDRSRSGTEQRPTRRTPLPPGTSGDRMTRPQEGPLRVALGEILENAPIAVFVKDADSKYLYINKHDEDVTGISCEEAAGRTDFDLYPPPLAALYREADLQVLRAATPSRFEEPVLVRGRERVYAGVKFPILADGEVVAVCGISIDVTPSDLDEGSARERQDRAEAFFGRLLGTLTPQEVRVLDLVATGLSDREIAEKLSLSSDTVRHHVSHLLKKLRKRRAQVIIEMLKRGRS